MIEIDHARSHTPSDSTQSVLTLPPVIKMEHEHQHHQLEAAVAAGGKIGMHASEVAAMLLVHFAEEEAYAMPPLRLLEPLARNEPLDDAQVQQAIQMAERLRHEYSKMLREHKLMIEALSKLALAGKEEGKPDHVAFVEALIMHAQNEEQVLYPATLVASISSFSRPFAARNDRPRWGSGVGRWTMMVPLDDLGGALGSYGKLKQ